MEGFHSFLSLSSVALCVCVCVLYSFLYQRITGCFYILATVNNVAMNIEVHISFQISVLIFFEQIPRNRIVELYSNCKTLRRKHSGKLFDITLSNAILDNTPQARETKAKIKKWDFKLKRFCTVKEIINKMK